MGEFFKPWRRKAGVLTLLMALAFMGLWIRGFSHIDSVYLADNEWSKYELRSSRNGFEYEWSHSDFVGRPTFEWYTIDTAVIDAFAANVTANQEPADADLGYDFSFHKFQAFFDSLTVTWDWSWCGFGVGERGTPTPKVTFVEIVPNSTSVHHQNDNILGRRSTLVAIPHWPIVVPLTIISLGLLLTQPGKPIQTKLIEPAPNEGA